MARVGAYSKKICRSMTAPVWSTIVVCLAIREKKRLKITHRETYYYYYCCCWFVVVTAVVVTAVVVTAVVAAASALVVYLFPSR